MRIHSPINKHIPNCYHVLHLAPIAGETRINNAILILRIHSAMVWWVVNMQL